MRHGPRNSAFPYKPCAFSRWPGTNSCFARRKASRDQVVDVLLRMLARWPGAKYNVLSSREPWSILRRAG